MPIFEFHCKSCDKDFETLVLKSDEKVVCANCRSEDVVKLMSCCAHKTDGAPMTPASGGSSCGSCTGGSCASCH